MKKDIDYAYNICTITNRVIWSIRKKYQVLSLNIFECSYIKFSHGF